MLITGTKQSTLPTSTMITACNRAAGAQEQLQQQQAPADTPTGQQLRSNHQQLPSPCLLLAGLAATDRLVLAAARRRCAHMDMLVQVLASQGRSHVKHLNPLFATVLLGDTVSAGQGLAVGP